MSTSCDMSVCCTVPSASKSTDGRKNSSFRSHREKHAVDLDSARERMVRCESMNGTIMVYSLLLSGTPQA